MESSLISPINLLLALCAGILPSLLWLWFWLREDRLHPEPKEMIALAFVGGMIATLVSYPIERAIVPLGLPQDQQFIVWVIIEEVLKYAALVLLVLRSPYFDEPIDAVIYMMTIAIGFSGLENALFLLNPIGAGDFASAFHLATLRFLGASLLHTTSSAIVGIVMALTYFRPHAHRVFYASLGLLGAIAFHTTYNLSLIKSGNEVSSVFIGLWVAALGILVACERIRRMPSATNVHDPRPMNISKLNFSNNNATKIN